jgi:hypothetical protein
MPETGNVQRPRQRLFHEMVLGTLVYAVVLGFFEDYTEILSTWSYTITFLVAIVLQLLTYLTLWLKALVVRQFRGKEGKKSFALMAFAVWLLMFSSKFVFLGVIELVFGSAVDITGFIGLMLIIVTMTIAKKLIDIAYARLA